jgi:integrase
MEATLRFELRMDTVNKKGEHPLILTIRIAGQRKKVSTGVKLFPELWNNESQHIINLTGRLRDQLAKKYNDNLPNKSQLVSYQNSLITLKNQVNAIESRFSLDDISYSAEMVAEQLNLQRNPLVKKEVPSNQICELIGQFMEENENTRGKGGLNIYKCLKNHLQNYRSKTKKSIKIDQIDYAFMQSFQNFLIGWEKVHKTTKTVRRLNNITIAKQLSTLKAFLNYAKRRGYEVNDGYKDFAIKRQKLEVIALTQPELDSLLNMDLKYNKRLDQVRDVFCFSCVTGFRYSDLVQLKREHIKTGEIRLTVKKTKEPLIVPLNIYSHAILEKYDGLANPLPIISNQKFNRYIKELGEMAGINDPIERIRYRGAEKISNMYPKYKVISAHTGRKTFATLSLEKGIPAETVMKITGHADYKSFQRYVKVTEERKRNEMQRAWGAPA